uniref:Uncharacterized protein n=1 Tax=Ananas comosus var. bracteatus TaxID=296719 RepID=A0A6V7PSU5_ANACO|nr:unnamed protein product [Ananas comosus var. bracteatus]
MLNRAARTPTKTKTKTKTRIKIRIKTSSGAARSGVRRLLQAAVGGFDLPRLQHRGGGLSGEGQPMAGGLRRPLLPRPAAPLLLPSPARSRTAQFPAAAPSQNRSVVSRLFLNCDVLLQSGGYDASPCCGTRLGRRGPHRRPRLLLVFHLHSRRRQPKAAAEKARKAVESHGSLYPSSFGQPWIADVTEIGFREPLHRWVRRSVYLDVIHASFKGLGKSLSQPKHLKMYHTHAFDWCVT